MRGIIPVAIALLGLVAACSDGGDEGDGNAVTIEDFSFEPGTIEVASGTEIAWTNDDDFAHTVTARDDSFASERIEAGDRFERTFDDPGEYEYFCSIHNSMTGTVVVT